MTVIPLIDCPACGKHKVANNGVAKPGKRQGFICGKK